MARLTIISTVTCLFICHMTTTVLGYDNVVHIFSNKFNQLVTSTTLEWVKHSETPVVATENLIPENEAANPDSVRKNPIYICRVSQNGNWIPGQLEKGQNSCFVSYFKNVKNYSNFQVLESVARSARLTWVSFSKFNTLPSGAVLGGDDAYIIRRKADNGDQMETKYGPKHLIGKTGKNGILHTLSFITEDKHEKEFDDGEILVEIEPIRYELAIVKFDEKHATKPRRNFKELGSAVLTNRQSSPMKVEVVIEYQENYSLDWGKGEGIIKGLPTIIRFPNGTILEEISWDIPVTETRNNIQMVETVLEPNTAVNVTLTGYETYVEKPYNGSLVQLYEDGANRNRDMSSVWHEKSLKDLKSSFGPVYFLSNNSLVPTTTTTTTTTTSTTTTSTTTSTTMVAPPSSSSTKKIEKTDRKEENMINDQASKNNAFKEGMTSEQQLQSSAYHHSSALIIISTALLVAATCMVT